MKKEIRFEAIGGQGAHSAGKILAEAAVLGMGYSGNHFSSFGSEKRGSPVKSSVRYRDDGHPVRSAAPIFAPDLLVIFHQNLVKYHPTCCEGSHPNLTVLINTARSPESVSFPEGFRAKWIATVDALNIARKHQAGVNSVLLGALSQFCPEINFEELKLSFKRFFSHIPNEVLDRNLRALDEGSKKVKSQFYSSGHNQIRTQVIKLPKIGYENAPIGGVISNPGNTVLRNLSHSRKGFIPLLDYERCIQCGRCDMVCPDYCFVWQKSTTDVSTVTLPSGEALAQQRELSVPFLQGIDYQFCKGCQKCVQACPVNALKWVEDNAKNRNYSYVRRFQEAHTPQAEFPLYLESDEENES